MTRWRRLFTSITSVTILILLYINLSGRNLTQVWKSVVLSTQRLFENEKPEFPINEELFCKPEDDVLLLVAVYSGVDQGMERQFVRHNWGAYARTHPKIRLLFFIGLSTNDTDASKIQKESMKFHDIIQLNFTDTYRNLTLKSFAFFRWSQIFCKNAKHLLKIDCDMKIDLKRLLVVLERGNVPDTFQCGKIHSKRHPYRILGHKWYIPKDIYAKNVWPNYCYGPAYIVSKRIASKIATLRIPKDPFPVDDVYMTGILREKLNEKLRLDILMISRRHYVITDTKVVKGNVTTYIKPVWVKDIPSEKRTP